MRTLLVSSALLLALAFAGHAAAQDPIPNPKPCVGVGAGIGDGGWAFLMLGSGYGGAIVHTDFVDITAPNQCSAYCGNGGACAVCYLPSGRCQGA